MNRHPSHLWHYTCDHGHVGIGLTGQLQPGLALADPNKVTDLHWPARFVWLTDMAAPDRDALGLTSRILTCDRTIHRYRATDTSNARPWLDVVRRIPAIRARRADLEDAFGARPAHWWVSLHPVPAVYDPR